VSVEDVILLGQRSNDKFMLEETVPEKERELADLDDSWVIFT